jgi:hypothetical protein
MRAGQQNQAGTREGFQPVGQETEPLHARLAADMLLLKKQKPRISLGLAAFPPNQTIKLPNDSILHPDTCKTYRASDLQTTQRLLPPSRLAFRPSVLQNHERRIAGCLPKILNPRLKLPQKTSKRAFRARALARALLLDCLRHGRSAAARALPARGAP